MNFVGKPETLNFKTKLSVPFPDKRCFQLYCLGRLDLDQDRSPDLVGHGNAAYAQVLHNTNSECQPHDGGISRDGIKYPGGWFGDQGACGGVDPDASG